MADITLHPLGRHLRAETTSYVQHLRNGHVRHAGPGLAFWFRPKTAALAEVPLDDREQTVHVRARTADFQEVAVQATVTYRIVDPAVATTRIDFGISPTTGRWNATPLETLGGLLAELAQQPVLDQVAGMQMTEALAEGVGPIRTQVTAALADDPRLTERGLAVTDVRVVAVRTDPEIERALQTHTREQVQQEADRATYERRAMAVERERAIAENELQNQIELAKREEELVAQRGQNDRKRATEKAAADRIAVDAKAAADGVSAQARASQQRLLGEATADTTRLQGAAEAEAEAAKLAAYRDLEQATLIGLAVRELAGNLPAITNLTVTPDLLTALADRFVRPPAAPAVPEPQGTER